MMKVQDNNKELLMPSSCTLKSGIIKKFGYSAQTSFILSVYKMNRLMAYISTINAYKTTVINEFSSDNRKTATAAISSALPMLPSGCRVFNLS
jgi:hypothetical protein